MSNTTTGELAFQVLRANDTYGLFKNGMPCGFNKPINVKSTGQGPVDNLYRLCDTMNTRWYSKDILNLTLSKPTSTQLAVGVVEGPDDLKSKMCDTLASGTSGHLLLATSKLLADYCLNMGYSKALIPNTAPLTYILATELKILGITPICDDSASTQIDTVVQPPIKQDTPVKLGIFNRLFSMFRKG